MKKSFALGWIAFILLSSGIASAQPRHRPRVAIETARAAALARVPGEIRHEELEREHHRWIYSFEISAGRAGIEEVNVDADTGEIVSVEHERR